MEILFWSLASVVAIGGVVVGMAIISIIEGIAISVGERLK